MKSLILLFVLTFFGKIISAQTLFTYGDNSATKAEFLKAFDKNYQGKSNRNAALKEYLDLYINFKLKVKAAYDMHLDTLANQKADLASFRQQLEPPFLTDNKEIKRLTDEAFARSQKDIRLSHILIPFHKDYFTNGNPNLVVLAADSAAALKKINEVNDKLNKGVDFEKLAQEYSADPNAKNNKGDLGYITVFSLPYEMENVAYSLALDEHSKPFSSKIGYHIFRKTGERPALGRIKVSQILLAFDPSISASEKGGKHKLADSLYEAIRKGSSFEDLAKRFSNDKNTFTNGGRMPEFGVGQFDPTFESAVFSLKKDGELSKPIETAFGYHLVKRDDRFPVSKNKTEAENALRQQVQNDGRAKLAKTSFENQVTKLVVPKKVAFDASSLWKVTDTFVNTGRVVPEKAITLTTTLLKFPEKNVTTTDWLTYITNSRSDEILSRLGYPQLMDEFAKYSSIEYYKNHLEDYNAEFRAQLNEFKDGNLLFEIMERMVWNKAGADSAGLRNYYADHKDKYKWGKSADAIIFNANDEASANEAFKALKKDLNSWKKISYESDGRILADSGRFELSQIPITDPKAIKAGLITPVKVNPQDHSASFTSILKLYSQPSQRSFDDARGLVMNDYQNVLEEKWIAELKSKYPVHVNDSVFQSMLAK